MQKLFVLFVISSLSLLAFSMSGMFFVGTDHVQLGLTRLETSSKCFGGTCEMSHPSNPTDLSCLNRCISMSTHEMAVPFLALVVFLFVLFFQIGPRLDFHHKIDFAMQRWRDFLRIFLLHQQLSTIVLLN